NHSGGDSPPPIDLPVGSICTVTGSAYASAWAESYFDPRAPAASANARATMFGLVTVDLK
ncbi:MAG TPA: hypothetical protein VNS56_19530, partial [Methylomirabilota bacterium]|nr:hypothetical protein [Methylomirabilota bacterium]